MSTPARAGSELADRVAAGERRAVARLITLAEARDAQAAAALSHLHARTGRAHVIGITGAPGTGKSTLVDRLIGEYRKAGKKVGVVAVDPSSPFSGGAILGDRIRMQTRSTDPNVFIRSMATRGALGGLSAHTADAVATLDAAGYDPVLVETVGVGQAEVDIVRLGDTVVVVLTPNQGDDVQAVKAGLMEIADLFVVNKSDLTGSDKVVADVEASLMLAHPEDGAWSPTILRTAAEKGSGVSDVATAIAAHRAWAEKGGAWARRRKARILHELRLRVQEHVASRLFLSGGQPSPALVKAAAEVEARALSPGDAAARLVRAVA